jgi:hypothetical protein
MNIELIPAGDLGELAAALVARLAAKIAAMTAETAHIVQAQRAAFAATGQPERRANISA